MEKALKHHLGISNFTINPVHGGDINDAFKVIADKGTFFVKFNTVSFAKALFNSEKKGLELLGKVRGVKVPKALCTFKADKGAALVLEWINTGHPTTKSWKSFAISLATLHNSTSPDFGLDHNNFIGSLKQQNNTYQDWLCFYAEMRIEPQLKMAVDSGKLTVQAINLFDRSMERIKALHPNVIPALLHGDLWSGNLIFNEQGEPVFIDPAVYYGNREMDIAMMKLFGGFTEAFSYYQKIYPLDEGWEERLSFYQLYYILVHVNLFGGSYVHSAMSILRSYSN